MPTIKLLPERRYKYKRRRRDYSNDTKRAERQSVYQSSLFRKLREQKRRDNPLCEVCLMKDRTKLMEHIHHIISFVGKPEPQFSNLAYGYDNLISVCRSCHDMLHNDRRFRYCKNLEDIKNVVEKISEEE